MEMDPRGTALPTRELEDLQHTEGMEAVGDIGRERSQLRPCHIDDVHIFNPLRVRFKDVKNLRH